MSVRNVIAIGPTNSGKSWLLNRILGSNRFEESASSGKPRQIESASKAINDKIIGVEYRLNLVETPGLGNKHASRTEGLDAILKLIRGTAFNQLVVVLKFTADSFSDQLASYLKAFSFVITSSNIPWDSLTLVINQVPSTARDEQIINFRSNVNKYLGSESSDFICVQQGETPREGVFRYLIYSKEDGYQFLDRNFLAIISQSDSIAVPMLKTFSELEKSFRNSTESGIDTLTRQARTWGPYISALGKFAFFVGVIRNNSRREFMVMGALLALQEIVNVLNFHEIKNLHNQLNPPAAKMSENLKQILEFLSTAP